MNEKNSTSLKASIRPSYCLYGKSSDEMKLIVRAKHLVHRKHPILHQRHKKVEGVCRDIRIFI